MKIYRYHRRTGEFMKADDARLDPLEAKQGVERYLIPACATEIEPPECAEHQKQVFSNGRWSIAKDWRGTPYFIGNERHIIRELGIEPPAGSTLEPPPEEFERPFYDGYRWVEAPEQPEPESGPSQLKQALTMMAKANEFNDLIDIINDIIEELE